MSVTNPFLKCNLRIFYQPVNNNKAMIVNTMNANALYRRVHATDVRTGLTDN